MISNRCVHKDIQLDELHTIFISQDQFSSFSQNLLEIAYRDNQESEILDLSSMKFQSRIKQEEHFEEKKTDWIIELEFGEEKYEISEGIFENILIQEVKSISVVQRIGHSKNLIIRLKKYSNQLPIFRLHICRKKRHLLTLSDCTDFKNISENCAVGYYEYVFDGFKNICIECPANVASCLYNQYIMPCQNCKEGVADNGSGCLSCIDGYYYIKTSTVIDCASCPTGCAQCTSDVLCQACNDGYSNKDPMCNLCTQGYYNNSSTSQVSCIKCPINCLTCKKSSSTLSCQTCKSTNSDVSNQCSTCVDGYYNSNTDASTPIQCTICPLNCSTCKISSSTLSCQTCKSTNSVVSNQCSTCVDGYYNSNTDASTPIQCAVCPPNCSTCTISGSKISCQTCKSTNSVVSNQCSTCVDGYYNSNTDASTPISCTICPLNCSKCTISGSSISCQACKSTNSDDSNQCSTCVDGYYNSNTDASTPIQCTICPLNCTTCKISGSSISCQTCKSNNSVVSNQCSTCIDGYYNSNAVASTPISCTICPINCTTCAKNNSILSCSTCKSTLGNLQNLCNCINGYYNSNVDTSIPSSCSKCPVNCTTCENGTKGIVNCTSCDYGYYVVDGQCSLCDVGYFNSNNGTTLETVQCNQCSNTCMTCSGTSITDCIKCQKNLQINPLEQKCLTNEEIEANIESYNTIRNSDCNKISEIIFQGNWEDRVACQNNLDFSQQAASFNKVLSFAGVSIGGLAGLVLPQVSTSMWLFVQNQQLIGNNVLSSKFQKMGLSKYHLSNSYSFHLFEMIPPLIGSSSEMFKDKDYYSSEIANKRILNEEEETQIRLLTQVQSIKPLFIENCSCQILLIIGVFLLAPIMFLLGRGHIIFQYIYSYSKWSMLIRVFMLTFNSVCIFAIYSLKQQYELKSSSPSYSSKERIISGISLIVVAAIWIQLQIQIIYKLIYKKAKLDSQVRATFEVLLQNVNEKEGISSMFWVIYSFKNLLQCLILGINDQNITLNYWIFASFELALLLFIIIFDALRPTNIKLLVCFLQIFQVSFNILLALITKEEDEDKLILFSKSNFLQIFIIMMTLLNGIIFLSTVAWTVNWLYRIFIARKKKRFIENSNQVKIIGQELTGSLDDFLNSGLDSSFRNAKF